MELITQNGAGTTPAAATMAAVLAAGPTAPGPAATGPAAAPAVPTVVDLDAGQTFGSVSYVVKRPFKLLGIVYNGLSFREPVGRDLKAGTTREQLACILGNFPPEVMAEMHAGDVIGVVEDIGLAFPWPLAELMVLPTRRLLALQARAILHLARLYRD